MGNEYGPTYGTGDTIGLGKNSSFSFFWNLIFFFKKGYDLVNDCIFFTKNSQFLGIAFREVSQFSPELFYPVIGCYYNDARIAVVFEKENFKFDLNNYVFEKWY